jgi:long-subunit acyl-CoA synthetase (AMP-forming)
MKVKTPLEKFYEFEQKKADQTFLRQPYNKQWHHYSWKKAGDEIRRMAAGLKAEGFPEGSKIGLISKNCAHWIMTDLAIMMAGHVSVPIYPTVSADTINYILTHSEAVACFVGKMDEWETQRSGVPDGVKCYSFPFWTEPGYESWDEVIAKHQPLEGQPGRDMEDLITIIYTSGTTGVPKGVVHNFLAFSFAATYALHEMKDLSDNEKFFSYLPLSHVAERMLVEMGGIYTGGMISFAESLEDFVENLKDTKPTVFLAVPRIWTKFQQKILEKMPQKKLDILLKIPILNGIIRNKIKEGLGLQNTKYALTGAAPLPLSTMNWFESIGIPICEAYAMTENCAYSHITRKENRRPGYVGQVMPHTEVRITDEGEILVKNPCVMIEYYKEPEKTAETITSDGFLCTGDQGVVDAQTFLKITGRVKDIFKTDKGKYVAPAPIEMALSKNTLIEQICLVGTNLTQPIGLVVLSAEETGNVDKDKISTSLTETLKEVNETLDKHEVVKKLVIVKDPWSIENNMITPTMKIKRNEVEKKYCPNYESWYSTKEVVVWE